MGIANDTGNPRARTKQAQVRLWLAVSLAVVLCGVGLSIVYYYVTDTPVQMLVSEEYTEADFRHALFNAAHQLESKAKIRRYYYSDVIHILGTPDDYYLAYALCSLSQKERNSWRLILRFNDDFRVDSVYSVGNADSCGHEDPLASDYKRILEVAENHRKSSEEKPELDTAEYLVFPLRSTRNEVLEQLGVPAQERLRYYGNAFDVVLSEGIVTHVYFNDD